MDSGFRLRRPRNDSSIRIADSSKCMTSSATKMTNRLFIFGYGYTARALVRKLREGDGWSVAGTTRSPERAAAIAAEGVEPIVWDNDAFDADALSNATHILISTPPDKDGCPALNAASDAVAARAGAIRWIGYLSTNGVYGDHDGAWVDETSELRGQSARAKRRIAAEAAWRAFSQAHGIPVVIFRLPGIYGPGRSAVDTVRNGTARRIYKEGQVFSRMHVDDIAAALAASIDRPGAGDLFNLADDAPAPPQDVVAYACDLLGVEPPPLVPIEKADLSDMAKSFYTDNKRVSNRRMKDALGVTLAYPTFRDGLKAILAGEQQGQ